MNATVNWLKRRVSQSAPLTTSSAIQPPDQPYSSINHYNNNTITTLNNPTTNEPSAAALVSRSFSAMNISASRNHSHTNPGPMLMQHDIIDPASPLSILAATSKLTTFPYGELQALNARMNMDTPKINGVPLNGINAHGETNGISSCAMNGGGEVNENGAVPTIPNSLWKQKLRSKDQINSTTAPATAKTLLPSAMPLQPPNLAPDPLIIPPPPPAPSSMRQRIVSTSALPRTRSAPTSRKTSTFLSSIPNTRRSSKRLKAAHPTSTTTTTSPTTPPKPVATFQSTSKPETPSVAPSEAKKRVLPVRQGHIDILDGEISLLSTPQRLDNRPSFETSHKVILVEDSIPSTPTTRYEPFSASSIPDPNTSPTTTRPKSIAAPQIQIRPLPSRTSVTVDPLPDSLYLKPHRKLEFTEIRLRNREREKIDYESSLLERQLLILKSEDWRKIVAPAAAERDGLKEGEVWDWEGRRERRIALLEGVLKRVRTWRDAEIKMRRGMLEKKPEILEKRKWNDSNEEESEVDSPVKRRRRGQSAESKTKVEEEPVAVKKQEEGKRRGGRRNKPTAFGQEIPKAGLLNREFQIPLDWVPEDKRL